MVKEMKLPELGENIESAQVLSVLVSPGDTVERDQAVIELETDKATAEVPSEVSGVVKEVRIKEGDEIKVGQIILTVEENGAGPAEAPTGASKPARAEAAEAEAAEAADTAEAPEEAPAAREPAAPEGKTTAPAGGKGAPERTRPAPRETPAARGEVVAFPGGAPAEGEGRTGVRGSSEPAEIGRVAPAAPSVRRLARELGIDVEDVPGTGPGGRISQDDVKAYTRYLVSAGGRERGGRPAAAGAAGFTTPELPDFSAWGEVEREPATKLRRLTGEAMAVSWRTIPHVTQFDRADITELEAWRKRRAAGSEDATKITVTAVAVKVAAVALRRFPRFNASFDDREHEIVLKKYVNVGVAVDTDRGLLVPVIRDADRKGVAAIAAELTELAEKARTRKISAEELQGANFNISNLGGLGTTYFSPIVNWPQVAVLGMGRATREPVYRDAAAATPEPRLILPLAVSYDHRVIDGADAARFLRWFAEALEQPLLLALEG
jgi:pyruvate dehydrogenase E2 component (dihydrolipoamide acetyltransferase)